MSFLLNSTFGLFSVGSSGGGGSVSGANNGTSLDGANVVLGNELLGVPGPAALLSDREISAGNFAINISNFDLDPELQELKLRPFGIFINNTLVSKLMQIYDGQIAIIDPSDGRVAGWNNDGFVMNNIVGDSVQVSPRELLFNVNGGVENIAIVNNLDGKLQIRNANGDTQSFFDTTNGNLVTIGNIGIGTSTPGFALDIQKDTNGTIGFNLTNSNAGTGAQVQNRVVNNIGAFGYFGIASSNASFPFAPIDGGKAFVGSNDADFSIFTQSLNDIIFYPHATEAMRIKSDGTINFSGVQSFADNAAAILGGLDVGDQYRTGDFLKVVH